MGKTLKKQTEKKKTGIFQKILLWLVIPILLIVFLTLLTASIAGVNVYEKAKEAGANLPLLSSLIGKSETVSIDEFNKRTVALEAQIEEKNAHINRLEREIDEQESKTDILLQDKKRLEKALEEKNDIQSEGKRELKEIVAVYETMTPKRASSIILEMKDDEAVHILSNMASESLARIMEKMPPDKAAAYTRLLTAQASEER